MMMKTSSSPPLSSSSSSYLSHLSDKTNHPHVGFTKSLLETLAETRGKVDVLVQRKTDETDAACRHYERRLNEEQQSINHHVDSLLAVQLERGCHVKDDNDDNKRGGGGSSHSNSLADRRAQLLQEQEALNEAVEGLQDQCQEQEILVQELQREESRQRERAERARDLKRSVQEAKNTTVEDLTRGILHYKHLGLDFVKAQNHRLQFAFSQLDAGDPQRRFSFVLNVNDEELYQVDECDPHLPHAVVDDLCQELNDSDDLAAFVRGMRNAFSRTL